MLDYIKKASQFFKKYQMKTEYKIKIKTINEDISFNFGLKSIGSTVEDQVEKLSNIFADELPTDFIAIATDAGGNILVANQTNEHIYYYDYNYNFTHLDETLPEPEDFDVMTAYNSYLTFNNYKDLFQQLI